MGHHAKNKAAGISHIPFPLQPYAATRATLRQMRVMAFRRECHRMGLLSFCDTWEVCGRGGSRKEFKVNNNTMCWWTLCFHYRLANNKLHPLPLLAFCSFLQFFLPDLRSSTSTPTQLRTSRLCWRRFAIHHGSSSRRSSSLTIAHSI